MRFARSSALAAVAMLIGCAAPIVPNWVKAGASKESLQADMGQCRAQAYGVPGVSALQAAIVYDGCMQGKGYAVAPSANGRKTDRRRRGDPIRLYMSHASTKATVGN
jgi:hypothetical protein